MQDPSIWLLSLLVSWLALPWAVSFTLLWTSPFVITCNSHKPSEFCVLGQVSSFSTSLALRLPCTNSGVPWWGLGYRCLFNFCPQHFKTFSQGLDCGHQKMSTVKQTVTPIFSSPPASGRQIISPTVYCLFSSHINFRYNNNKLIAASWLLGGAQHMMMGTLRWEEGLCLHTHFAVFWTFSPISKPGHCYSNELPVTVCITRKTLIWHRPTSCHCKLLWVKPH